MTTGPTVEVIPATLKDQRVLANLLELYCHDFSEIVDMELSDDGRFGWPELSRYWAEAEFHPFLIRTDGKLAGFALARSGSQISDRPAVMDVAQFFVVRGHRRKGVGMKAAHQIWRRFPGAWEVRVMEPNHEALVFWQNAVAKFVGAPVPFARVSTHHSVRNVFTFESK